MGVVLYAIFNIKDLLGRNCIILTFFAYQTCGSQPYNLTWWIPKKIFCFEIVKVCKNLQNLFVREMISNWGHPALLHYLDNGDNMTISSSVMIPVIFTILSCIRQRLVICYVIIFVFFWVVALIWRSTIWQLEMISYLLGSY